MFGYVFRAAALIAHQSGNRISDFGATWRAREGTFVHIAQEPFRKTPQEVWDAFPDYVRGSMAAAVLPEARAADEALGYNLSFVLKREGAA